MWFRRLLLAGSVVALLASALLAGCGRVAISNDFRSPYERESVLMPQTSRSYVLTGPSGVRVDVGIDFEEGAARNDHLRLTVDQPGHRRQGAHVPGGQLSRAVCGVELTPAGVPVVVQNLNALRSAPFALRIARSPSRMCSPRRVIPSSALVQTDPSEGRGAPTL